MIAQEVVVTAPNSAAVWIALIGSLTTLAGLLITQFVALKAQAKRGEEQTEKLKELKDVGTETHELVNSKHDEALKEIKDLRKLLLAANKKADNAEKATAQAKAEAREIARAKAAKRGKK